MKLDLINQGHHYHGQSHSYGCHRPVDGFGLRSRPAPMVACNPAGQEDPPKVKGAPTRRSGILYKRVVQGAICRFKVFRSLFK
jgi:hypothetical protein